MMNIIKHGIITLLVSFAVFFFMPVFSFASDFAYDSYNVKASDAFINYVYSHGSNEYSVDFSFGTENYYVCRYSSMGWATSSQGSGVVLFYDLTTSDTPFYIKSNQRFTVSRNYYNGLLFCGVQMSNVMNQASDPFSVVSYSTNIPDLTPLIQGVSDSSTARQIICEYILNNHGVGEDFFNASQPGTPSSLGYIKPSYYLDNHVGSSGAYEIITWASTSTTGVDLTDSRYNVQFALRDKSYTMSAGEKSMINFDTYPNFVEGTAVYLGRNIYNFTHDNVNNAILQGKAVPMSTYNNMVSLGITSASSRRFAFNAMNEYSNSPNFQAAHPEIAANLNNVINANIQEFIPGGFLQRIFNDSNLRNLADFQLSYDIYARISDSQSGTKGNWLLIDKHGRPVKDLENVLNGGSTIRPVKVPDFEPTSDFTTAPDDEDIPDEELDDNDTVKDEPLPTGYIDPSSGDGVNNYYNYTYNYDNRTWIENHYDNQTVEEVNEGLEWIKMFPGFFGLFLKFFGAFLPGWAVVCVTIAIPIIIGLLIFKAIKGVIPFV